MNAAVSGSDVADDWLISCSGVGGLGRRHQLAELEQNLADEMTTTALPPVSWRTVAGGPC
jgi:hypothetical protein